MVIYTRNYAPALHPVEMLARPMEFLSAAEQDQILSGICADAKKSLTQYAKGQMACKPGMDEMFPRLAFEAIWAAEALEMDLEVLVSELLIGVIVLRGMESDLRMCLRGKCRQVLKKLIQQADYVCMNPAEDAVELRFLFYLWEKDGHKLF